MRISELGSLGQVPDVAVTPEMVRQIQPLTVLERARITSADAGPRFDLSPEVNEDLAGLGQAAGESWLDKIKSNWILILAGVVVGAGLVMLLRGNGGGTRRVSAIPTYPIDED